MLILVVNSGSSSLKYQVRDTDTHEILTKGLIDRIGESEVPDHRAALLRLSEEVGQALQGKKIEAVGHRVVHGGERFSQPVLVDNEITRAIERLSPLAPLHGHPGGRRTLSGHPPGGCF